MGLRMVREYVVERGGSSKLHVRQPGTEPVEDKHSACRWGDRSTLVAWITDQCKQMGSLT